MTTNLSRTRSYVRQLWGAGRVGSPSRPFLFRPRLLPRWLGAGTELGWRGPEGGPDGRPQDMTAGGQAEGAGAGADPASARLPSRVAKLLSALFYGTCSFLLVLINKALLTTYR